MSAYKGRVLLLASFLGAIAFSGWVGWWTRGQYLTRETPEPLPEASLVNDSEPPFDSLDTTGADGSSGKSLLARRVSSAKRTGLTALSTGDYDAAVDAFNKALKADRNDPETRIYLNNATVGQNPAHTIAVSMPISQVENPALEVLRGVAQVQTEVNATGGINGTPLKVLIFDDGGDPLKAKAIATALVADKNVLGVVGHYSSDTSLAASEVYQPGKLPMVSPISTAVKLSDAGEYIFRTVPSDRLAAETLALHALEAGRQSAAVFYTSESAYSRSLQSEFTTAFVANGGKVIAEVDTSQPDFNAKTALAEAKSQDAEVIMLAMTIDTADTSLDIIAANRRSLPMVGGDDLYDPKILTQGKKDSLGLTVAVPWHIRNHLRSRFVKASRGLWGGDVNWRTVTGYDAATALVEGIRSDIEPSRSQIAEAMRASDFSIEGATEPILFFRSGDRNQPSQLVEVVPGNRSGAGYDYMPLQQATKQ